MPAVDSASLSLTNMTDNTAVYPPFDLTASNTGTWNLTTGYYLMNIRLEKNGGRAGRTDVVHIYHGLTTRAEYVFTDDDFCVVESLADGEWKDGNMIVSGPEYYRFPVTSGNIYEVYWNDSYVGDGLKNLDIKISAYYESTGIPIFSSADSGYNTPQTFTAPSNDNVILNVVPYSFGGTGTYAVKYVDKSRAEQVAAAAAFSSAHSVILGKTVEDIVIADEPWVDAALSDYDALTDAVQALLAREKDHLDSLKAKIVSLAPGSITLAYPADEAAGELDIPSISISKTPGQTTYPLTVSGVFDTYQWRVDGLVKGNDSTLTLNAGDYAEGTHQISLELTRSGAVYSKSGSFTVTP
jgi:hypothetical protein